MSIPTSTDGIFESENGVKWKAVETTCPMCKADDYRVVGFRGGEYHRDKLGVESKVVQCRKCELYYSNPFLLPLSNPYAAEGEYFVNHDSSRKVDEGAAIANRVKEIIGRTGTIIEPACGTGDFLLGAQKAGWDVRGIEMTQSFVEDGRKNGLDIEFASIEESKYLEEEYDAMLMLAMLEHLYDPMSMLQKAHGALKTGGVAIINVPNEVTSLVNILGNAYVKGFYGRKWTMSLSPTFSPYHVVGFSPKSLRNALEMTGFEVLELITASGESVLPTPKGVKQKLESVGLQLFLAAGKVADRFNRGNEIMCWARKK